MNLLYYASGYLIVICKNIKDIYSSRPSLIASTGHTSRQSLQFVQFISAGLVAMSQIFVHLSQSLHALVLKYLNIVMLLAKSSSPPVGQR